MPTGAFAPLPLRLGGSAEEGISPEQHARMCADLVAVKRTAVLARVHVNQNTGGPFAASVTWYLGQNGAGIAYGPAITVVGAGDVRVTFPAIWTDEYGIQFPLKIRHAIARGAASSVRFSTCEITGSVVRVRTFNDSGVATATPFTLRVW